MKDALSGKRKCSMNRAFASRKRATAARAQRPPLKDRQQQTRALMRSASSRNIKCVFSLQSW